jgi:hypothetical protein
VKTWQATHDLRGDRITYVAANGRQESLRWTVFPGMICAGLCRRFRRKRSVIAIGENPNDSFIDCSREHARHNRNPDL